MNGEKDRRCFLRNLRLSSLNEKGDISPAEPGTRLVAVKYVLISPPIAWCFDLWWFDDKEEGYDCSGDGGDAGIFWWGTLKFLKVGNSSKKTNQQKIIFPEVMFPRTFLAAQTWWLQPDVQRHTHHLLCQTCRGLTMFLRLREWQMQTLQG